MNKVMSKGQSMNLSYWRERANKFEAEADGYWQLWNDSEAKLEEARRNAKRHCNQKNRLKKRLAEVTEELRIQDEANDLYETRLGKIKERLGYLDRINGGYLKLLKTSAESHKVTIQRLEERSILCAEYEESRNTYRFWAWFNLYTVAALFVIFLIWG